MKPHMPTDFHSHLERYGPASDYATPSLAQARSYCARLARTHYENFSVASLLLPRKLLPHFHAVYAYCRWADDLGDEVDGGPRALALLDWWRRELLHCYQRKARHPVLVALEPTIRRFAIPSRPFLDLVKAFEQDQQVKRYESFEQLVGYCRNSANPAGRLVLYLCEVHDEQRGALADSICTGLQLANFWQDVARDYAIGRVYLPAEDRQRFGYTDADLDARRFTPAFGELMRFEVDRARGLFQRGRPLVEVMPVEFRGDIEIFIAGGLAILRKIEHVGYNVWAQRPVLDRWEKAALLGGALWRRAWRHVAGS
jgi:squalene synthase HpnC